VGGSVGGEVTTDKQGGFQSGKVTVEQGAVVTTKRELGWDNKGRMTVYEGTRAGAEGSIGPVKGGASYEEGSGYTMENGQVTSTFTKTVTETSAGLGPVGGSTKVEVTTAVPGPGVGRM